MPRLGDADREAQAQRGTPLAHRHRLWDGRWFAAIMIAASIMIGMLVFVGFRGVLGTAVVALAIPFVVMVGAFFGKRAGFIAGTSAAIGHIGAAVVLDGILVTTPETILALLVLPFIGGFVGYMRRAYLKADVESSERQSIGAITESDARRERALLQVANTLAQPGTFQEKSAWAAKQLVMVGDGVQVSVHLVEGGGRTRYI